MIYIHVPFCRSFCTYCGFYSEICKGEDGMPEWYGEALLKEMAARHEELVSHAEGSPRTLYIGGGTPSVLPLSVLSRLLEGLNSHGCTAPGSPWEEFTFEVNPDDVVKGGPDYAEGLLELGVTRVSMGVQSFDDSVLKWMNRRHSAAQAREAFRVLREAGFDDISVDLIFGFETTSWERSLDEALALRPEHISAYQLSVEPDSALERMVEDGRFAEADERLCRSQYDLLCSMLADAGYEHYEISNFALPGRRARHNSGYWRHCRYAGLGPGAHSFDGKRTRSWNDPDLKAYLAGGSSGSETLSDWQLAEEVVMLGLRTSDGVPESAVADDDASARLMASGALVRTADGRIRIPEDHFFVSDSIISDVNCPKLF